MRKGLTLVEVMLVIGILGVISTLAFGTYSETKYRARLAEAPVAVTGVRTAEVAYGAARDRFVAADPAPSTDPGPKMRSWDPDAVGFKELGWAPDGDVRGQYMVTTSSGDFRVTGIMDVDGDDLDAVYTATKSISTTFVTGPGEY